MAVFVVHSSPGGYTFGCRLGNKYLLSYYKRLDEQIRNHEMKAKSLDMRRRILKNQRSAKYQNEYDK